MRTVERLIQSFIDAELLDGVSLRRVQQGLATGDRQDLADVARDVATRRIAAGDLVRVEVSGREGSADQLYSLRGHAALFDLTPLDPFPEPETPVAVPAAPQTGGSTSGVPVGIPDLELQERLLHAMERAQTLQAASAPGAGVGQAMDDILDMLAPYLGDLGIYLELPGQLGARDQHDRILSGEERSRPFWTRTRVVGEAVWLTRWHDLPANLRSRFGSEPKGEEDWPAGVSAAVAIPVFAEGDGDPAGSLEPEELGLLYLLSYRPADRDVLIRLGFRLSRFVTHGWHQKQRMSHLVHTDALTGVRNRGFFDAQFALELERARRQETPLALLIGDIDHFKDINDRYGHLVGDRVLKSVACELLQGLRRIDMVCRVGGEEFALVLPDTPPEAAREVVTRIQVGIANLRMTDPTADEPLRVTISFGGASFPEAGLSPVELYRKADEMLYLSKQRGRNRCHYWNQDGDPILSLPRYQAP